MKVLMLSFDPSLVDPGSGDSRERLIHYSKFIESLTVLVVNSSTTSQIQLTKKIKILSISGSYLQRLTTLFSSTLSIVKNEKVTLIVAHDPILGLAGVLTKLFHPTVRVNVNVFSLRATNLDWLLENPLLHLPYSFIQLITLYLSDSIRVDGKKAKTDLEKIGISPKKIVVIPIVPAKESITVFKKNYNLKRQNQILSIGSLIKQKNFPLLLDAFEKVHKIHPKTKLLIIGKGPEKQKILDKIKSLKLANSVTLLDSVPYTNIPLHFQESSIFALTSLYEGFPRVLMEAALSKTPIVTSDIGGARDFLVDGKSGFIISKKSPEQFATKIIWLLTNPDKAMAFSILAQKQVLLYCDFDSNLKKLMALWKKTENQT